MTFLTVIFQIIKRVANTSESCQTLILAYDFFRFILIILGTSRLSGESFIVGIVKLCRNRAIRHLLSLRRSIQRSILYARYTGSCSVHFYCLIIYKFSLYVCCSICISRILVIVGSLTESLQNKGIAVKTASVRSRIKPVTLHKLLNCSYVRCSVSHLSILYVNGSVTVCIGSDPHVAAFIRPCAIVRRILHRISP